MDSLELERTYLAKELPKEIDGADYVEIVDIYIPEGEALADLRLRKKGDKYYFNVVGSFDSVKESVEIEFCPVCGRKLNGDLNCYILMAKKVPIKRI